MVLAGLKAFIVADSEVATAYYAHSAATMAEIARILGREDDEREYEELSANVRKAYRRLFASNGIVRSRRQCRYVRPIALDLIAPEEKAENARVLDEMVRRNAHRIGTGFLTTQHILSVLTDHGYAETAYAMLENTRKPSWLYSVTKGATTILEDWEGIGEKGALRNSFNHYAFGTVVKWLFRYAAGIECLEPGYRRIRIRPVPGGSFRWVRCSFDSPCGMTKSEWSITGPVFELAVDVPVDGEVCMPHGTSYQVPKGAHRYRCAWNGGGLSRADRSAAGG